MLIMSYPVEENGLPWVDLAFEYTGHEFRKHERLVDYLLRIFITCDIVKTQVLLIF